MDEATSQLRTALVSVYPTYVARTLNDLGVEMDDVFADAIVEGVSVLDGLLSSFVEQPLERQRHSPLELFGEALRPIDRTLAMSGVPSPVRGSPVPSWDRYGIAPGSSQVLGPEVHAAHLRWGAEKAVALGAVVLSPALYVLCQPADRDDIGAAASEAGYRPVGVESADAAAVVLVDASLDDANASITHAVAAGKFVVVYKSGLDDLEAVSFRAVGADRVVDRSVLLADFSSLVPIVT
ncbi:MAG: hypothetical protein ACR2N7_05910 [Acidimicrobiia bacterium]